MKLCKDCQHFQGETANVECTAPGNRKDEEPNYVRGGTLSNKYNWVTAQICRTYACGPEAKWFEPKDQNVHV